MTDVAEAREALERELRDCIAQGRSRARAVAIIMDAADAYVREVARPLYEALERYVTEQGRMLDGWAEGDESRKRELWVSLHLCEGDARKAIESALPYVEGGDE